MGATITDIERDGDICVITVSLTSGGGTARSTVNVVGQVIQIEVTSSNTAIASSFSLTLNDSTNGMQLYTGTIDQLDVSTSDINNGTGAYCRGVLEVVSGNPSINKTVRIYYEKM